MTSNSEMPRPGDTVVVVGGRGFVGSRLTAALARAGYRPHVFGPSMDDDLLAGMTGAFGETVGSVEDRAALVDTFVGSGAKAVVTTAAHSVGRNGLMKSGEADADAAMAINVLGFRNVVESATKCGNLPVVWTSSTVVYGTFEDYPDQPVDEAAPTEPYTFYGLTKVLCENLAAYYGRRHGLPVTALRLPLILGPNLWYQGAAGEIMELMAAAREERTHRVAFHDDPMDLMHVDDVARAVLAVFENSLQPGSVYNINGFRASMSDILATLADHSNSMQMAFDRQPASVSFPAISDRLFRQETGFEPRFDLHATIASLLEDEDIDV